MIDLCMKRAGRGALFLMVLAAPVFLSGCRVKGRPVKKQPAPEFVSPIAPTGRPGMTLADIRSVLQERRVPVKSVQAAMTLTVGSAESRGRQQFDASVFFRPASQDDTELLRVRGSADAGPVFDFLLHRREVQTIVYPERKYYRGSLSDLRANPNLLAGVQPDDLVGAFLVERALLQRIRENPGAAVEETPDRYTVSFQSETGMIERFHLRASDLLVDLVEQGQGQQVASNVRYYGYRWDDAGGLVPTRYDALMAGGAEVQVEIGEAVFNAPATESSTRIAVPDGYDRLQL